MPMMDSQRLPGQFAASTMRILILGGTTEASALAQRLAGDTRFEATLSLAGRTSAPRAQPLPTRVGGFGGVEGLARYLREHQIDAVIDVTHPYADQMSANAVAACKQGNVPLASLARPPWQSMPGDKWQTVSSPAKAAAALGPTLRRVFLSLGRLELHAFAAAPQHHYVARIIDPPEQAELPPDLRFIQARGPFDLAAERKLLVDERIEVIVSKDSGGSATYPKIAAARELGLPVIMIERPYKAAGELVASPDEAIAWLARHGALSRRGV
jgi:precorrin-6A/cobalt-precorrin-6A reductase